jgi:hypothetical protein
MREEWIGIIRKYAMVYGYLAFLCLILVALVVVCPISWFASRLMAASRAFWR